MRRIGAGLLASIFILGACGPSATTEQRVISRDAIPSCDPVGDDPAPSVPPFPEVIEDVRFEIGLDVDAACAANRTLRDQVPQAPGATLVALHDRYSISSSCDECSLDDQINSPEMIATGVVTTWTYEFPPSTTKCAVAAALEDPMRQANWKQRTLETTAPDGRNNVRNTDLYKRSNYVSFSWSPSRLSISVTANSEPLPAGSSFGADSPFIPCFADPQP